MRRRYIYDAATDTVVEVGPAKGSASAAERYAEANKEYQEQFNRDASPRAGDRLRDAALERADRREFAQRRYGDERRWRDT